MESFSQWINESEKRQLRKAASYAYIQADRVEDGEQENSQYFQYVIKQLQSYQKYLSGMSFEMSGGEDADWSNPDPRKSTPLYKAIVVLNAVIHGVLDICKEASKSKSWIKQNMPKTYSDLKSNAESLEKFVEPRITKDHPQAIVRILKFVKVILGRIKIMWENRDRKSHDIYFRHDGEAPITKYSKISFEDL